MHFFFYCLLYLYWLNISKPNSSLTGALLKSSSPELELWKKWRHHLNWADIQWVGLCDVPPRPLLGHFNYSRAGCNWSGLRGISLSMKMSPGVNTAEKRFHLGAALPFACLQTPPWFSRVFPKRWKNQASVADTWHVLCPLSSWYCVVTQRLKTFIRLLDNASRWG